MSATDPPAVLSPRYFDDLYARSADPWGFRSRVYEARKRALTLAALPSPRYGSVLEPGCSIGVLTAALAERADRVVAMDVAAAALEAAAVEVPDHVELRQGAVPADWPPGRFDLVVVSEVGYYLDRAGCRQLWDLALGTGGDVVAVHWRHHVEDYPLSGDEVHEVLEMVAAGSGRHRLVHHEEEDLLLEVWSDDPRSPARRSGLL